MTTTIQTEVIQPEDKLAQYAGQTGLENPAATSLAEVFRPIYEKARTAIDSAKGVAESVKDATCVKEIKKSRECRLAIRAIRLESESTRKKQKEHALLYGRAVDGFHNILMADLSPVETSLQEAEDVAERAEAARLSALKVSREKELLPHLETPIIGDLSELSEADFAKMLSNAKLLKQAKIDSAAKAEAEAKAKQEAERLERERIAAENAKLKAEAEAREAAAKAEREAAAKQLAEERAAAEKAAKEAADKARKEREEIEAKAKAERLAAEKKAQAERAAAEEESRKEKLRLRALAEVERRKLAAAEAEAKALREAETKKAEATAAASRKAAAAPDNAKAKAFADSLRSMPVPTFKQSKAFDLLPSKVEALAKWIESQIPTDELI